MFTFILSCVLVYYIYDKTFRLQKRIDILEYEMSNLNSVLFMSSTPLLEYNQRLSPSAPSIEF